MDVSLWCNPIEVWWQDFRATISPRQNAEAKFRQPLHVS